MTDNEPPSDIDEKNRTRLPAQIARLADDTLADEDGPYTIHGVAIAEDELTYGAGDGGLKLWPADELRRAAATLDGQPITRDHPEDENGELAYPPSTDDTVGRVTGVGYHDGVGVVYEGSLSDRELARKIRDGILDVSPDAAHLDGGTDEETEAMRVADPQFLQLGIVSKGAGAGNTAQLGPSRALASLSASDIGRMVGGDGEGSEPERATDESGGEEQPDDESAEPDDPDETQSMSNEDDDPEQTPEDELNEVKARLSDTLERNRELETENERLADAANEAALAYAELLFDDEGAVTPETAVEKFSPAELKAMYDESDVEFENDADEPDVQSGAGDEGEIDDENAEEIEQVEQQRAAAAAAGMDGMEDHYAARLSVLKEGGN